jgi:hypothetical protein
LARDAGCRISFETDAHGPSQLRFMALAVASALQAGVAQQRVSRTHLEFRVTDWVCDVRGASIMMKGRHEDGKEEKPAGIAGRPKGPLANGRCRESRPSLKRLRVDETNTVQ